MSTTRKRVSFEVFDSEGVIYSKDLSDVCIPIDFEGNIKLKSLLDSLRKHFNLGGSEDFHLISYYSEPYDCFVLCGQY